jgi:2-furoate---CoA ligase
MPLYHTMGIHSLLAMHHVGGCFVSLPRWDAAQALRLIEEERITSPTWHRRSSTISFTTRTLRGATSLCAPRLRRRGDDGGAWSSCAAMFDPRCSSTTTAEESTRSRSACQRRPGCAGDPRSTARLELVDGEVCADLAGDEAFAGYWQRPDADKGDPGRLVSHRRHGAHGQDGDPWIEDAPTT